MYIFIKYYLYCDTMITMIMNVDLVVVEKSSYIHFGHVIVELRLEPEAQD